VIVSPRALLVVWPRERLSGHKDRRRGNPPRLRARRQKAEARALCREAFQCVARHAKGAASVSFLGRRMLFCDRE
jgi:hypothetical protein